MTRESTSRLMAFLAVSSDAPEHSHAVGAQWAQQEKPYTC